MNAVLLIVFPLLMLVGSALMSGVTAGFRSISRYIAGAGSVISCFMLLIGGTRGMMAKSDVLVSGHWHLLLTPLNSVWMVTIALCGVFTSLFSVVWHQRRDVAAIGLLSNLILASSVTAILADNVVLLVVMTEMTTLAAYLLTGCRRSGQLWFVLGRTGTLILIVAIWLLWHRYGTVSYAELRQALNGAPLPPALLLLILCGFGLQSGLVPLHSWVASAHAHASAPACALYSGVVMKIGLYGIVRFSLLSDQLPLWWAMLILIAGLITAFAGGLYALMEHNINRLLAYHTIENIGIILLGLGCGFMGMARHNPVLEAIGIAGGLYHLFNHSLFKTTLFLCAGAIRFQTGHYDIEKLGGIGKRMPLISLIMLVGLMSMAALPPLNGFASEWLIYQSFFRLSTHPLFVDRLLGPLLAVGLAITGALAVMCVAKVYGVIFLGASRTQEAERALPPPRLMTFSAGAMSVCCITAGIASPWLLPLLQQAIPVALHSARADLLHPITGLLLIAAPLLPLLIATIFRRDRLPYRSRGSAWACGYQHEPGMVITSSGFTQPIRAAFRPLLALRHVRHPLNGVTAWQEEWLAHVFRRLAIIELTILLVAVAA